VKLSKQVMYSIDDMGQGKFDSALLHACIGIDATSKKMFPVKSLSASGTLIASDIITG
jgi:hypothetical protein